MFVWNQHVNSTRAARAFTFADLLVTLGVLMLLAAVAVPALARKTARSKQEQCLSNLKQISHAVLVYTEDYKGTLPMVESNSTVPVWWWYKELVKSQLGLVGPPSPRDRVFACPNDRGYDEPRPFHLSPKFYFGSYVFNGVNLPGIPNLAGKNVAAVKEPSKTLLMMEWSAHAPLSWHKSRTGKKNQPFYNDAENMVGFVDGHADFIKIYYDGLNAAYTRDPIPGYNYKYSPD
jgi:type II secretory pathway pseudopilin PulG